MPKTKQKTASNGAFLSELFSYVPKQLRKTLWIIGTGSSPATMAAGEVEGAGGTNMGIGMRAPGIPCGAAGGGGFMTALLTERERMG